MLSGGPFTFCVDDQDPDQFEDGSIILANAQGSMSTWVVTDEQGNILGLPASPYAVNFDGAGTGTCLIWHLSFESPITGAEVGMNAFDIQGCFSLSNSISVIRHTCCVTETCSSPDLSSFDGSTNAQQDINSTTVTVGNARLTLDRSFQGTATADENRINNSQTSGEIGIRLGVKNAVGPSNNMKASFNLSEKVCDLNFQIWDIDQTDEIVIEAFYQGTPVAYATTTGACVAQSGTSLTPDGAACEIRDNGSMSHMAEIQIEGCIDEILITSFDQGNGTGGSYTVVFQEGCTQIDISGGSLQGGPFEFCVSDGTADRIPSGAISLEGNGGTDNQWVVTDLQGNILGLPPMPSVVDFDGAGIGTCLIWNLSYENDLTGVMVNNSLSDINGCYTLSNPVYVQRTVCCTEECSVPDIAVLDGDNNAEASINSSNLTVGTAALSLSREFNGSAQADENRIDNSQTDGSIGVRLGVKNAIGSNNNLTSTFSFTQAVCGFSFEIWDIDQTDEIIIEASYQGTSVPYSTTLGSCVAQTGQSLTPDGAACEVRTNGSSNHMASIVIDGCIDAIKLTSFDQGAGSGGSYTIVLEEGCTQSTKGGTLTGGPFDFCVGDGAADNIPTGAITLTGNSGTNSQWVVTDDLGNILGLPPMPSVVDFNGAGVGTCLIWHLSFEEGLIGAELGMNASELQGCYSLSNPISVVRNDCDANCMVEGGTLTGGPFEFCVGDAIADNIPAGAITLTGNNGMNRQWVVTDDLGNILGLPPLPSVVDFDGAGVGTCLIWHLSFEDGLIGAEVGMNSSELQGCFSLSNPISVFRNQPDGGQLVGLSDVLVNRTVIANRASGTISVIDNDEQSVIMTVAMPNNGQPMYVVHNSSNNTVLVGDYNGKIVSFDGESLELIGSVDAGQGVFHMWLSPNSQQLWVNNELDKTISVIDPNGLVEIATIQLPDDLLAAGYKPHDVIIAPDNAAAFVTLLGPLAEDYVLKYSTSTFLETARVAVGIDPHVSLTAANDLLYVASQGSSELAILNRSDLSQVDVLSIPNAHGLGINNSGTYLYVGNISEGGVNATYTVDLTTNTLVGSPVDAPFAAPHNYAVSDDDGLLYITHSGATNNQVSVYSLDPTPTLVTTIMVENNPFGLDSYSFFESFTEIDICAGDQISDAFDVRVANARGSLTAWVITDLNGNILGLPANPPFDLDGAGAGSCLIWHLAYENGLTGLTVGANASNLNGCYDLSDPILVNRNHPEGGTLTGGPFEFCVEDGAADNIPTGAITLTGNNGMNSQWVVTDDQGNILGLPPMPSVVDFDGAGVGTCLIWHLSFEDGLIGAEVGMNANELQGCYSLSNPITVVRNDCDLNCKVEGGTLTGGPFEFCVGDGAADNIPAGAITLTGSSGTNSQWVVTDDLGNILGLPPMPSVVDFDGAGVGTCLIWHLSFEDRLIGAEVGMNANELQGCYSLSNPISVVRNDCNPSECLENRQEDDNPIMAGLYEVYSTITSIGVVSAGDVDFSAVTCIELGAGFEVEEGNIFHAFIDGCDAPNNPQARNTEDK